jgi:hypothetical protein
VTDDAPKYTTGALWGVLTVLLLIGTVASAFGVWGLTDLYSSGRYLLDVSALLAGGFVAALAFLLMAGILYRVDRIRGVLDRRVELFE